jgi:hypothetical protein
MQSKALARKTAHHSQYLPNKPSTGWIGLCGIQQQQQQQVVMRKESDDGLAARAQAKVEVEVEVEAGAEAEAEAEIVTERIRDIQLPMRQADMLVCGPTR